ncbi:hypothetical protein [Streptomyces sp. TLI_55]|uniref:hypothetical protein n=1 Tax=Streptomyces sp. TLI_55 TaxID=1938861 RepID=UPI0015CF2069|nr:hypothetical protein [Streptomyces sp. TLI_55]
MQLLPGLPYPPCGFSDLARDLPNIQPRRLPAHRGPRDVLTLSSVVVLEWLKGLQADGEEA